MNKKITVNGSKWTYEFNKIKKEIILYAPTGEKDNISWAIASDSDPDTSDKNVKKIVSQAIAAIQNGESGMFYGEVIG